MIITYDFEKDLMLFEHFLRLYQFLKFNNFTDVCGFRSIKLFFVEKAFLQSNKIVLTCPGEVPKSQSKVFLGILGSQKNRDTKNGLKWLFLAIFGYVW